MKNLTADPRSLKRGLRRATLVIVAFLLLLTLTAVLRGRYPTVGREGFGALSLGLLAAVVQEVAGCAVAWIILASAGQKVSFPKLFLITTLSTSVNSTLPVPAGIPIRVLLQKQVFGTSPSISASTLILETAMNYCTLLLAAAFTPLLWPDCLHTLRASGPVEMYAVLAVVLLIAAGAVFLSKRIGRHLPGVMKTVRTTSARKPASLTAAFLVSAATLPLSMMRAGMALGAVGASCRPGPLLASLVFSRVAGLLSMIPMGLGARDLSFAALLGAAGVPALEAAAASALDRLMMTIPYLLGGVIGLSVLFRSHGDSDSGYRPVFRSGIPADDPSMEPESVEAPEPPVEKRGDPQ